MRPYITKIIAIVILVGAIMGANLLKGSKKKNKPKSDANIPTAFISMAKNENVAVNILENGRLSAKHKIDLYSEVEGLMEQTSGEFKAGEYFSKGEVLVKIKSNDFYANLQAQKSILQNLITAILPDLKSDYPEAYDKWNNYLRSFDIEKPISPLPEPTSEKEKYFLTGKNIYTTYYNTKNLEITYNKYILRAPYSGVLTEALVTPGSLVRKGQRLGEFIDPSVFELELALSKELIHSIKIGTPVTVTNPENREQSWNGKVTRINGKINSTTQTIQVFVQLKGETLKEGMYLEANIAGKEQVDAIELQRNLLIDNRKLYAVDKDSLLFLTPVQVLHKTRTTAIVQGVEDGTWLVQRAIPGAYSGMKVTIKTAE